MGWELSEKEVSLRFSGKTHQKSLRVTRTSATSSPVCLCVLVSLTFVSAVVLYITFYTAFRRFSSRLLSHTNPQHINPNTNPTPTPQTNPNTNIHHFHLIRFCSFFLFLFLDRLFARLFKVYTSCTLGPSSSTPSSTPPPPPSPPPP